MRIFVYLAILSSVCLTDLAAQDQGAALMAAAQVPLSFEQASSVNSRWIARGNGYRLAIGASEIEAGVGSELLRVRFVGADTKASSTGLDKLPGKVNYFVGNDPTRWRHDIPTYARVRYRAVYPGTDIVWYGNQGRLEYDLMLHPGADASRIAMRFDGARKLSTESNGDLRVEMARGSLILKQPDVYQQGRGGRERVAGSYELQGSNEVRFRVAPYDKSRPLVIDPTLVYATYFGIDRFTTAAAAVDSSGNLYIGGNAYDGVPAVNALQPGSDRFNAFVTKFDPTGTTILYSTYFGGTGGDTLYGIAADSNGNVVAVGQTSSTDFPLSNPQPSSGGVPCAFAFKLSAAGDTLLYSTYLAGSGSQAVAVALDPLGNAYITGTAGTNFQTTPGALSTRGLTANAFVIELATAGNELYAAWIGATSAAAISVDAQGAAYVAGYSVEESFPNIPPGARTFKAGGNDAYVIKVSPDGTSLIWATFLGGSGDDEATGVAIGSDGVVYVGGTTTSSDLPVTAGAFQTTYGGGTDSFVASVAADGSSFGFVTYLGGVRQDTLVSLAVGSSGIMLAGNTYSRDFPVLNALQPAFPAQPYTLLKSTDSGSTFVPADSGLPGNRGAFTVLPDPSAAGTLIVDTGQGVFRSTDDGVTWVMVEPNSSISIGGTARSLSNPSVLYTSDLCNLYQSTDGGQTWHLTNSQCLSNGQKVVISPTDPDTVIVFNENTEYRSTDGGQTFPQSFTIPFYEPYEMVASTDGSLYVQALAGLWKSTDTGETWTNVLTPSSTFTLSLTNPPVLYALTPSSIEESTNGGLSWTTVSSAGQSNNLAVAPSNSQVLYVTNSYGGLVSVDGGVTWNPARMPLDTSVAFGAYLTGITVNPSNPSEVYLTSSVEQFPFISKLSLDGKSMIWSTYYGGHELTTLSAATLTPSGDVWVTGSVIAGTLPITPNAQNSDIARENRVFLARIADTTAPCSYSLNPSAENTYIADLLALAVTAPSGCPWNAIPSDSWIHVIRPSGTGSGTIPLYADENLTQTTRTGTVSVEGQTYTLVEPGLSCIGQVSVSPSTVPAQGGTITISEPAPPGCPWYAAVTQGDATIVSASSGTGNLSIIVSFPPNYNPTVTKMYWVQVGALGEGITQQAGCFYVFPNGTNVALTAEANTNSILVQSDCAWNASSDQSWLTLNNPTSSGNGNLSYNVTANNTGLDRVAHVTVGGQQITVTQAYTSAQFNDVAPSIGYFDAVNLMFQAGVTTGCVVSNSPSTRSFCPNDNVTREEMAAFIVRAVTGTSTPANYNPTPYFTDVPPSNPFFADIQKFMDLGITTGCAPNLFCPNDTIPRWEMAIFMVRARLMLHGAPFTTNLTPYFADVPTNVEGNGVAFPFIQRSYEENITAGCATSPLQYCPDEIVTRWQMASFIMRALFNEVMALPPNSPILSGASPNTIAATPGAQLTLTITGANTNFTSGDTVTVPSGMLTVSNVMVNSATSITATLTAAANIAPGPQALVVTTGGQNLTLPLAIEVGTY